MSIISVSTFNQGTGLPNEIPEWVLPLQEQVPVSGFNNDADYISQSSSIYIKDGTGYFAGNGSGLYDIQAPNINGYLTAARIHVSRVDGLAPVALTNDYDDLDDKPDLNALEAAILGAAAGAAAGAISSAITNALGGASIFADAFNDFADAFNPFNDGSDPENPQTNKEEDYRKVWSWYNLYDRPLVARQKTDGRVDTGFFGNIYCSGVLNRDTNIFVNSSNNIVFETQTRPSDPILDMNTKDAWLNNIKAGQLNMGSQVGNNLITLFGLSTNKDDYAVMGFGYEPNSLLTNLRNSNGVARWRWGISEYANMSKYEFIHRGNIVSNHAMFQNMYFANAETSNNIITLFGASVAAGDKNAVDVAGFGFNNNSLLYNLPVDQTTSHKWQWGGVPFANLTTKEFHHNESIRSNLGVFSNIYCGNHTANNILTLWGPTSLAGNSDTVDVVGFGYKDSSLWYNSRNSLVTHRWRFGQTEYANLSTEGFGHVGNIKAGNAYLGYGLYAQRGIFNAPGDVDPRVGIGLGAPQATLHISSPANTDKAIFGSNADNGGELRLLTRQVSLLGHAGEGWNKHGVKLYLGQYDTANAYVFAAENDKGELDASLLNGNLWLRGTLDADEVKTGNLVANILLGNGAWLDYIDAAAIRGNLRVVGANVGVSTQDPQERLDVQGAGNVGIRILSSTAIDSQRVARLDLVRWDGVLGNKAFGSDVNTDWRMQNDGNLCFISGDTITGNAKRVCFFANGAIQAGAYLGLGNLALGNTIDASQVASGTLAGARLPFGIGDGNLRVVGGNVGIGAQTPLATFHVEGNVLVSNGCIYANCIQTTNIAATGVIVGNGALLNNIQAQSIVGILPTVSLPYNIGDGTIQVRDGRVWVNYPPVPPGSLIISTGDNRISVNGNVGADYFFGSGKYITQVQWNNIEGAPDFGITGGGDDGGGGTSPFDIFKEAGKLVIGGAASMVLGGASGYATSAAISGFGAFSARMKGYTRFTR